MEVILQLFILIFGFLLLVKGADFFVDGSSKIAKKFGISELIIGLTIVAMGTSAPETAVSIAAALKGTADISIGNVVGSNILNILLIIGICALIKPVIVKNNTIKKEINKLTEKINTIQAHKNACNRTIDRYEEIKEDYKKEIKNNEKNQELIRNYSKKRIKDK